MQQPAYGVQFFLANVSNKKSLEKSQIIESTSKKNMSGPTAATIYSLPCKFQPAFIREIIDLDI